MPRFYYILKGLPHYSIDENDIVEFSLSYMGGDLYPMWFKYGPLYSYILAAIYWVQHLFFDGTLQAFVESYFFESTSFYYTARFVNGLLHLTLAGLTFYIAKRWVSIHTAFFASMLAWSGFRSAPVYYHREKRFAGATKYTFRKMLTFSLHGITSFSTYPLKNSFRTWICG